jgi:hypothetical protein
MSPSLLNFRYQKSQKDNRKNVKHNKLHKRDAGLDSFRFSVLAWSDPCPLAQSLGVWNNMNIAIDSNALTYLISAMEPDYDPLNDIPSNKKERQAMLRIFLYQGKPFYVLPQVTKEYHDIPSYVWRNMHGSTVGALLIEFRIANQKIEIDQRREDFLKVHENNHKDCQLLAEAEVAGMNVLLTRDKIFKNTLSKMTTIRIMYPSEYCESLNLQSDISPHLAPVESNPLFGKTWWKIKLFHSTRQSSRSLRSG